MKSEPLYDRFPWKYVGPGTMPYRVFSFFVVRSAFALFYFFLNWVAEPLRKWYLWSKKRGKKLADRTIKTLKN